MLEVAYWNGPFSFSLPPFLSEDMVSPSASELWYRFSLEELRAIGLVSVVAIEGVNEGGRGLGGLSTVVSFVVQIVLIGPGVGQILSCDISLIYRYLRWMERETAFPCSLPEYPHQVRLAQHDSLGWPCHLPGVA